MNFRTNVPCGGAIAITRSSLRRASKPLIWAPYFFFESRILAARRKRKG
jgi:hypothetical protein